MRWHTHHYHVGQPGAAQAGWQAVASSAGRWVALLGVLIQGVPGQGGNLTLARILHPPSLHLPPAPAPSTSPTSTATAAATARGDVFVHIREREGTATTTTTAHGPRKSRQQQTTTPTATPTAARPHYQTFPHEPNLSRLESSTVDPGPARASFSTSGIQSRAAADELGPHSAFLASWRANLRVNPGLTASHEPFAGPDLLAGTERLAIDSFSFSASSL